MELKKLVLKTMLSRSEYTKRLSPFGTKQLLTGREMCVPATGCLLAVTGRLLGVFDQLIRDYEIRGGGYILLLFVLSEDMYWCRLSPRILKENNLYPVRNSDWHSLFPNSIRQSD